jgi:hypothetical protein
MLRTKIAPWSWTRNYENALVVSVARRFAPLGEFLCSREPLEIVASESVLKRQLSTHTTMGLFVIMQHSQATAEGMYGYYLEFQHKPHNAGRQGLATLTS